MNDDVIKKKLKTLYVDLVCTGEEAETLVRFMNDSMDDKNTLIHDVYFHDHSPVKVLNPSYDIKGGKNSPEDEIIAVSEGYDHFIRKIGKRTNRILSRHNEALNLLLNIFSLPEPYARLLYLRYYKNISVKDVSDEMFLSKSSCYRKEEEGIQMLNSRLEDNR